MSHDCLCVAMHLALSESATDWQYIALLQHNKALHCMCVYARASVGDFESFLSPAHFEENFCIIKDLTTPEMRRYTTL